MKTVLVGLIFFIVLMFFNQHYQDDKIVNDSFSRYNARFLKETSYFMQKPFSVLLQYLTPQHGLSAFAGNLANSKIPWLKNYLIRYFLNRYKVNMSEAIIENPYDYESFNAFFTRHLKPSARPIAELPTAITSPADGTVSQIGNISDKTLLQAKGFDFNLVSLLGGSEERAEPFIGGTYATFYLSPKDYHRVHTPLAGILTETVFIPGKLFSVNQLTTNNVPQLFARNERLVCIFETEIGPMAVILVGAMLVGSIETAWPSENRSAKILAKTYDKKLHYARGDELGYFKMGSTVIILFGPNKMHWQPHLTENSSVRMGELIGNIQNKKG